MTSRKHEAFLPKASSQVCRRIPNDLLGFRSFAADPTFLVELKV
jgi:hypothetical protein